ncbi:MAG: PorT family protein [Bacteroidia bacterium]|nr:PorT family protein [Bacteroidia bacterium]
MKARSNNGMVRFGVLVLSLLLFTGSKAQEINPTYDLHRVHFGFSIIGNYGKLKYATRSSFLDNDTIQQVNTKSFPGFGVGGIMNLKIAEYWDFRTMVNIQFVERHLEYNFRGGEVQTAKLNSTYMEIPLLLKYKSKRNHNKRFYWVGGVTYRYDFASDIETERSNTKPVVALYPATFSYDFGAGLDLYYEFFKFSPEIRISNGIGNSMVPDQFIYASALSRMSPKLIQFFLHFEG